MKPKSARKKVQKPTPLSGDAICPLINKMSNRIVEIFKSAPAHTNKGFCQHCLMLMTFMNAIQPIIEEAESVLETLSIISG